MVTVTIFPSRPDRIALGAPRVASEKLQDALAPRVHRIIGLEQAHRRHAARPLERAEEDVVGIAWPAARQERIAHQHFARRLEGAAHPHPAPFGTAKNPLERHAEALLARGAEVGLVLLMHDREKA